MRLKGTVGRRSTIAALAMLLAAPFASAKTKKCTADVFPDFDWAGGATLATNSGGTAALTLSFSGGNPDSYGKIRIVVNGDTEPPILGTDLFAFFPYKWCKYDPREHSEPIFSVSYSEDVFFTYNNPPHFALGGIALRQNGKVYISIQQHLDIAGPAWTNRRQINLAAASFQEVRLENGQIVFGGQPDFGGSEMEFGFYRGRGVVQFPMEVQGGIDNFEVTINYGNTEIFADRYEAIEGVTLEVPAPGLLANDISNGRGAMSASLAVVPIYGSVDVRADGSFTYRPAPGYWGSDVFSYRAGDTSATAEIAVRQRGASCKIGTPLIYSDRLQATVNVSVSAAYPVGGVTVLLEILSSHGNVVSTQTGVGYNQTSFTVVNSRAQLIASGVTSVGDPFSCFGYVPSFVPEDCLFGQVENLSGGSNSASALAPLRRFRDELLASAPSGRQRIEQYYRHSPELIRLIRSDFKLLPRALLLYQKYKPLVQAIVAGELPSITTEQVTEVDGFLRTLEQRASPELRTTLGEIRADLHSPEKLARVGIRSRRPAMRDALSTLPIRFEPNRGQADRRFDHLAKGAAHEIALAADRLQFKSGSRELTMRLLGANAKAQARGEDRLPSISHYLFGRDPTRWYTNIPNYAKIRYSGVYPGVDLVYYGQHGRIEYDLVVAPGSDPGRIAFHFDGTRPQLNQNGDLTLAIGDGELRLHKPVVYQQTRSVRKQVPASFSITPDGSVKFQIAAYDRTKALVIDPVLTYASYLGGQGTDVITAMALGSDGSIYLTGSTNSQNFLTSNPLQPALAPGIGGDVFVTKLNAAGTAVIYSTYLGGADDDAALGIAVDQQGNAYITGATRSGNFPVRQPFQAAFGGAGPLWGTDAFVTKLNPSGSALVYSTYLGGVDNDGARGIAVSPDGSVTVAGATASPNFPTAAAMQGTLRGGGRFRADAFVSKLNAAGTALVYSTFLGGTGDDMATAVALDSVGHAYITGLTYSTDFPLVRPLPGAHAGGADVFVSKLRADGAVLLASTYLGGSGEDIALGLALGSDNRAHITGMTGSLSNFPLANAAQLNFGSPNVGGYDAFAAKLDLEQSRLVYSTFLGGSEFDAGFGIALDAQGNAYITGVTYSPDFASGNAPYPSASGPSDSFIAKLDPTGSRFLFRSYLGGAGGETAMAVAASTAGAAYFAGSTTSVNLPVTAGALQTSAPPQMNGFLARMTTEATPCEYTVSPAPLNLAATASAATFNVATAAGCAWSAKSLHPWTTITSPATRIGPGAVTFSIAANSLTTPRTGGIEVADRAALVITQAPSTTIQYQLTISASPSNGGTVTPVPGALYAAGSVVAVQATPAAGFTFSGWSGPVSNPNLASTTVTMDASKSITANFIIQGIGNGQSASQFVRLTPCRVADTRTGQRLSAQTTRDFLIPLSGCGVPSTARAYSINITVVPTGYLGFLTAWPAGAPRPLASTLNSWNGRVVANAAIVPAGVNGAISIYVANDTDVIIDINGYFAATDVPQGLAFYAVTPCRVSDTRPGLVTAGTTRTIAVPQSTCAIPTSAQAYSLNITAVPPGYLGFLTAWPAGLNQPLVSTLNSWDGQVVPNAAIVPAGTNGAINIYASNDTAVVIDINGYFAPPGGTSALRFYSVAPCRVSDTRSDQGKTGPFGPPIIAERTTRDIPLPLGGCGVPSTAKAYSVNLTAVPTGYLGYVTTWPTGAAQPLVSTLNSWNGQVVANAAIVPAGTNGSISVYVSNGTDLVVDINGYFAP